LAIDSTVSPEITVCTGSAASAFKPGKKVKLTMNTNVSSIQFIFPLNILTFLYTLKYFYIYDVQVNPNHMNLLSYHPLDWMSLNPHGNYIIGKTNETFSLFF
jgi:hypothetical protein